MLLSTFPQLFTYSFFAITLIRIFTAFIFLKIAINRKNKTFNYLSIPEVLVSITLFIGLYTQISTILIFIFTITEKILDDKYNEKRLSLETLILLAINSLAILFLGPGGLAFDMPL